MTAVIAASLATSALGTLLTIARLIRHDGPDTSHTGADLDYADQLAAMADTTVLMPAIPMDMAAIAAECPPELAPVTAYQGRHHEDTVGWVPPGWMPPTADQRIAATLDDTQQMEPIR